ncbi:hypothetical protein BD779DRAFT_107989 [Infundibulicybe gibba]|nr:hypothetical protein BD779DRAFT_107989 [Infundibulicybe gibba]
MQGRHQPGHPEQSQLKFEAGHDHGAQTSPRSVMNEYGFQSISGNGTRRHSEYRYTSGGMRMRKGTTPRPPTSRISSRSSAASWPKWSPCPNYPILWYVWEPACAYQPTTRRDPDLMPAVGLIITRLKQGGRLIYIGAGADGCLGVLDVAELARKFSASPASFIRLIAGGAMAVEHAARAAEDAPDAVADLGALMTPLTTPSDILIGVVTSRSMTYALAGMSHARALGALTIGFTYANWSAPGDPRICECVVECDPKLKSGWENSETEKNREIQSVLIKLSKKLGEYTRPSGGMVETGAPDGRDKNVAPRRCTGARGIAHTKREAGAT